MELIGYASVILMGITLGMIGGGGSILTVPILVYFFAIDPLIATMYSLFVVGATSLVGGVTYYTRAEVDLKTGIIFALPGFVGVYISRHFILPNLPNSIFSVAGLEVTKSILVMFVFSVLMVLASVSMIRGRKEAKVVKSVSVMKKTLIVLILGILLGMVTGFVGAGGGFLIIPTLVLLIGIPMKIAVGTSLLIISANSLFGFFSDLRNQVNVDWRLLITVLLIALVGLFVGMSLSSKVSDRSLKKVFGWFVLTMGTFILIDQIRHMY